MRSGHTCASSEGSGGRLLGQAQLIPLTSSLPSAEHMRVQDTRAYLQREMSPGSSIRGVSCTGLLPTLSPAGSMERSGSVPSGPRPLGSGPLPSLHEQEFKVSLVVSLSGRGLQGWNPIMLCMLAV